MSLRRSVRGSIRQSIKGSVRASSKELDKKQLKKYEYTPLDLTRPSLRLLKVLPLGDDNTVECELLTRELPTEYTALSYCWGYTLERVWITILSPSSGERSILPVRKNLYDFLLRLSRRQQSTLFWIDAICLDQTDILERNHQVQQMGSIYQGARGVQIWLGNQLSIARLLSRTSSALAISADVCELSKTMEQWMWKDDEMHTAALQLWKHEYWSRIWIIQEVLLADSLHVSCGDVTVPWSCVTSTFGAMWGIKSIAMVDTCRQEPFWRLKRLADQRRKRGDQWKPTLDSLLISFSTSGSLDVRDKVFAMLALVENGHNFRVDYHIPIYKLFLRVWRFFRFWDVPGSTEVLAIALKIDLKEFFAHLSSTSQSQIDRVNLRHVSLGKLTWTQQQDHWNMQSSRRAKSAAPAHPICPMCSHAFTLLSARLGRPKSLVWCTSLGTESTYHIIFEPMVKAEGLSSLRFAATMFIYSVRGTDYLVDSKSYSFTLAQAIVPGDPEDALIKIDPRTLLDPSIRAEGTERYGASTDPTSVVSDQVPSLNTRVLRVSQDMPGKILRPDPRKETRVRVTVEAVDHESQEHLPQRLHEVTPNVFARVKDRATWFRYAVNTVESHVAGSCHDELEGGRLGLIRQHSTAKIRRVTQSEIKI